jgi:hypothetical protein
LRTSLLLTALLLVIAPASAQAALLRCSEIPAAQRFVDGLKPGPNTRKAQEHLEAAKRATTDEGCDKELRQVDKYARRSLAADKRAAGPPPPNGAPPPVPNERPAPHVACADWLHQDRPGGTDYHGPPVPGCPSLR